MAHMCGDSGNLTPAVSGVPYALEGGQNQKWPTNGHSDYLTLAVSGVPNALHGGQNHKWPTCGHSGYVTPAASGDPQCSALGYKIRNGPHVATVAT